jgi:hypothetical protein
LRLFALGGRRSSREAGGGQEPESDHALH